MTAFPTRTITFCPNHRRGPLHRLHFRPQCHELVKSILPICVKFMQEAEGTLRVSAAVPALISEIVKNSLRWTFSFLSNYVNGTTSNIVCSDNDLHQGRGPSTSVKLTTFAVGRVTCDLRHLEQHGSCVSPSIDCTRVSVPGCQSEDINHSLCPIHATSASIDWVASLSWISGHETNVLLLLPLCSKINE